MLIFVGSKIFWIGKVKIVSQVRYIDIDRERNLEKRLILEMIEILNNKNSIKKTTGKFGVFFYINIYEKIIFRKYLLYIFLFK